MIELDDRRVLAALELVDATTGQRIRRPLAVAATVARGAARVVRNSSSRYVLLEAPGLAAHTRRFEAPPAAPPLRTLEAVFEIHDPYGEFLPARASMQLPRDPDPGNADSADSLFQPQRVSLLPSPAAATAPGWAVVRVSVGDTENRAVGGALIRVARDSDDERMGVGLSEWRAHDRRHRRTVGEALVAIPGGLITTFGEGEPGEPVLVAEAAARVEVAFAPELDTAAGAVPDARALEARLAAQRAGEAPPGVPALRIGSEAVLLTAGGSQHVAVEVDLS